MKIRHPMNLHHPVVENSHNLMVQFFFWLCFSSSVVLFHSGFTLKSQSIDCDSTLTAQSMWSQSMDCDIDSGFLFVGGHSQWTASHSPFIKSHSPLIKPQSMWSQSLDCDIDSLFLFVGGHSPLIKPQSFTITRHSPLITRHSPLIE